MFHSKKRARVGDDAGAVSSRAINHADAESDDIDEIGAVVESAAGEYVPVALPPGTATSAKEEIVM